MLSMCRSNWLCTGIGDVGAPDRAHTCRSMPCCARRAATLHACSTISVCRQTLREWRWRKRSCSSASSNSSNSNNNNSCRHLQWQHRHRTMRCSLHRSSGGRRRCRLPAFLPNSHSALCVQNATGLRARSPPVLPGSRTPRILRRLSCVAAMRAFRVRGRCASATLRALGRRRGRTWATARSGAGDRRWPPLRRARPAQQMDWRQRVEAARLLVRRPCAAAR